MIIHGNKKISKIVYAHKASESVNAVRLKNIIRDTQVIYVSVWLTNATAKVIIAAFGQNDGWSVIDATDAYLNSIAETDSTKAQALAANFNIWIPLYVPEDKDIMYSLVPTLGTRWIINDTQGNYFNLGIKPIRGLNMRLKGWWKSVGTTTGMVLVGCRQNIGGKYWYYVISTWEGRGGNGYSAFFDQAINMSLQAQTPNVVEYIDGVYYENGIQKGTIIEKDYPSNWNATLYVFRLNEYGGSTMDTCEAGFRLASLELFGSMNYWFIPFKHNGKMELLDLVSGNLATRVGTFTELIEAPVTTIH